MGVRLNSQPPNVLSDSSRIRIDHIDYNLTAADVLAGFFQVAYALPTGATILQVTTIRWDTVLTTWEPTNTPNFTGALIDVDSGPYPWALNDHVRIKITYDF